MESQALTINSQEAARAHSGWQPEQDPREAAVATPTQSFVSIEDDSVSKPNNKLEDESMPRWQDEIKLQATLAWPIILTFVLESIPGIVCITLVGHINDGKARHYVDAATLSNMFSNLTCLSIGFGLTSALDTLCSQAYGAQCTHKIGVYLQSGFIVVGAAIVPMFLANWFAEDFLLLFGQDKEVAKLSGEFSRITVFGMPFLLLYEMLRKSLQAQGVVRPMVIFAVIGDLINVGGGYYLTYHTSLGFHGAALSRTLAYACLPFLLIAYVLLSKNYKQWWSGWSMGEAWRQSGLFLRLGIPGLLMLLMSWWGFEMLALICGWLNDGVTAVSTHAVVANLSGIIFVTYMGTSVAASIRVGNCLGANMPNHARLVCRISLLVVVGWSALMGLVTVLSRERLAVIFVKDDGVVRAVAKVLLVFWPYTIVDAVNSVLQGIFRGFGHQRVAAWSNAIGTYGLGLPLSLLTGFLLHWGVPGLWGAWLVGMTATVSVLFMRLCKTDWPQLAHEAQERTAL